MKAVLVAPPWLDIYGDYREAARLGCVAPPLGLLYLVAAVERAGHQAIVIDMDSENVGPDQLLERIAREKPDLVGLTATTPVFRTAAALSRRIRDRFSGLPLILGGVHATVVRQQALIQAPAFDAAVCGEGEQTIVDVLEALSRKESLAAIPGLILRKDGAVTETVERPLVEDLDSLPLPAWHHVPPDRYRHSLPGKGFVRYASLFTSRGCPYRCIFCSQHTMYGRRMRWHSVERVVLELTTLVKERGINHIILMDETLTLNRRRTLELCSAIRAARLNFTFEGWTHASTIDEELLHAMKRAGLIRLSFGIESGDPEILSRIKKSVTLDQIREAYRIAARVGIETRGSAMLGHPYETRETAWRTVRFLRSLRDCQQVYLNIACPYPGTEMYECARTGTGGMRLLTDDYSRYKRYGDPVIEVNDLTARDLKRIQRIGLLYFYLTPRRIWYNLIERAGPAVGLRNALAFLHGVLRSGLRKDEVCSKASDP